MSNENFHEQLKHYPRRVFRMGKSQFNDKQPTEMGADKQKVEEEPRSDTAWQ